MSPRGVEEREGKQFERVEGGGGERGMGDWGRWTFS
jgi:hypothetical protein